MMAGQDNESEDYLEIDAYPEVDDEAGISDEWLKAASPSTQFFQLLRWWQKRYVPMKRSRRNNLPVLRGDGAFHIPSVELKERFDKIVSAELLDRATRVISGIEPIYWASKNPRPPYNPDLAVEVSDVDAPLADLKKRIEGIKTIYSLSGNAQAKGLAENLAFGAAIAALESFLYETMVYWVDNRDFVAPAIVTHHTSFKDEKIPLKNVVEYVKNIKLTVLTYMQSFVWHQWDKVAQLFKHGIGLSKLNLDQFEDATLKRHDIVHRSGKTKDGKTVVVTEAEFDDLCKAIVEAAQHIHDEADAADKKRTAATSLPAA